MQDRKAYALLKDASATMKSMRSLRAEWQSIFRTTRRHETSETGTLFALKPNQMLLELSRGKLDRTTWAHDGTNSWLVQSTGYYRTPRPEPITFAPWGDFFSDKESYVGTVRRALDDGTFQSLKSLGTEVFEGETYDVVQLKTEGILTKQEIRLFIGKDKLIHRDITLVVSGESSWERQSILRQIERNFPLSPSFFQYTPPKELKELPPSGSPEPPDALLSLGKLAPDFVAVTREGKEVRLADFRGKVIVLDFWASWCPACLLGLPGLGSVARRFRSKNVVVLAVNIWDERAKEEAWITGTGKELTDMIFLHDPTLPAQRDKSPLALAYSLKGLPTQYVIDKKGIIRAASGSIDETTKPLEDLLKKL